MKISILLAKITACAILITAIHITFGADFDAKPSTRTQDLKNWSLAKAAQAATYTRQKAIEAGRYLYPYAKTGARVAGPYVHTATETAAPYVGQAADAALAATRTVRGAMGEQTKAAACKVAGFVAEWHWPEMINNLAGIQSTLYRLDATIKFLKSSFYNIVSILPPDQIDEIGRKAGLVTNVEFRPK